MSVVGGRPNQGQQPARLSSGEVPDGSREGRTFDTGRDIARELALLLNRCARGHEDAFADLYDLTSARVHGLVLRVLRAPDLAVEVTQEVYIEIWRHAARFDQRRGSAMAWMAALAHRRAVDRIRSTEAERSRDTQWSRTHPQPTDADVAARPDQLRDQVWDEVSRDLEAEQVRRALDCLSTVQREALDLAYFGGYSQAEVAALLDVPLGTVKTRIRNGLLKLRDALDADDDLRSHPHHHDVHLDQHSHEPTRKGGERG